jgi:hypothetical protein
LKKKPYSDNAFLQHVVLLFPLPSFTISSPIDFAGAHCQYLKALVDIRNMNGEALMPDIGDNFYGFTPKAKPGSTGEGIIIGFALCAVVAAAVFLSSKNGFSLKRIGKGFNLLSLTSESKSEFRKSEELELQTNAQVV